MILQRVIRQRYFAKGHSVRPSVRLSVIRFLCSAQNIREFAGRLEAGSIDGEIERILETCHFTAAQLVYL